MPAADPQQCNDGNVICVMATLFVAKATTQACQQRRVVTFTSKTDQPRSQEARWLQPTPMSMITRTVSLVDSDSQGTVRVHAQPNCSFHASCCLDA